MANFDMISALKPFKCMWRIKVKIVRLWKQYSAAGGETIEMVLVDSFGDKIHASVKKELVAQFDPLLREGYSKVFINFSLNNSVGAYRTTKHAYKIVPFREILNGSLNTDYLVDVIGQIVEVSHLDIVAVNGKDTQKMSLQLRNADDDRLTLVLWGKFALDVSDAIHICDKVVICVLRFGKIKLWKDDRSVSNAYNVSDVALNPLMDEVSAFRTLLPKDDLALAIVDSKTSCTVSDLSEKDDFFVHTPRKSLAEVLESRQVERCIVMCTIAAIDTDMGWYYLSCKGCTKKVLTVPNDSIDDGNDDFIISHKYHCVKCNTDCPKLLPRYKLHLVVLDNTSNTKFLLFDNLAVQLIRKPCVELTGPINDEIQEPTVLPSVITDLVGKTYLFKIGIEKENYLYKHDTFKVMKIITIADMINEFEVNNSPMGTQSTICPEFSTQSDAPEGSTSKIGGSYYEEVSRDLTPAKRSGTPIINLEESFDQNSSTKISSLVKIKKEKTDKSG